LDKDLLVKGNKIYNNHFCCFLPQEINKLLTKSNSTRGIYPIGVSLSKYNRFLSRISLNGKSTYLGIFSTPEEAFKCYKIKKESIIKELANKYKNTLDIRAYNSLMLYSVSIED